MRVYYTVMDEMQMTDALKIRRRASRLLVAHGRGQPNFLSTALQIEWLNMPIAQRPKTFSEYVIEQLEDK